MKVTDFDFPLPEELIAKEPAVKRDSSRLLVLDRAGNIEHKRFYNLSEYLNKGDMLLVNNTKVFPARLTGIKPTGGKMDFLLVKEICPDTWEILSKKRYDGRLSIAEDFSVELSGNTARFTYSGDFMENLWRYGDMPLPPYIKRKPRPRDKETYQTVYAERQGSIAAPTAGIHFTRGLIDSLTDKGVLVRYLTLHVGTGTFKPIRTDNVEDHSMDHEYFEIDEDLILEIERVKASKKKVFSVGTTTTRAIEGFMSGRYIENLKFKIQNSKLRNENKSEFRTPNSELKTQNLIHGHTDIFIYPGYEFKVVDSLITNFHLPRSTPLMLASAFCGWRKLKEAYSVAIANKYRFFSYGDAMLIL
jgi:S-adenosylmethionine:tRNA ribosyltransferase-isomerase